MSRTAIEQPPSLLAASPSPEPVLATHRLSVGYGTALALREVTVSIPRNRITALIGPSGCGKSTLLRCFNRMNDLTPGAWMTGEITYEGEALNDPEIDPAALRWIRRRIGMVFQRPNPFPKSIYQNVAWGARINGFRGDLDELVERSLRRAILWDEVKDKLHRSGLQLSVGQQQRLCMARTLAVEPEVILMDEPCSALDPIATARFEELIAELKPDHTIVIVTHDLPQVRRISDLTACLVFDEFDRKNGPSVGVVSDFGPTDRLFAFPGDPRTANYIRAQTAETLLRESEARTRLIVETAMDAVVVMDARGRITEWNPQAEATFGWTRSEVLGKPLGETIFPTGPGETFQRRLEGMLTSGGTTWRERTETTAWHRDGRQFPVELSLTPVRAGETTAFSVFLRDVTDRKRSEEDVRRMKEAAESANRAKSEFLANMSHEIRTPMNGILGMTELALDTRLTAQQGEYLRMVKSSADSLLTVINDILDFSKIEAGKLDLDPVPFGLRDCVDDTLKTLALRAHAKGLELSGRIAPEVPDGVIGDPGRLRQVIVNLVGNAIKFTEKGEVVVSVDAEPPPAEGLTLHFRVRDTGIGIPAEKLGAIFEPFVQADGSTTRRFGGTGLGLAISHKLVELMGGQVWVESEVGWGSVFHFRARFGLQPESAPGGAVPDRDRLSGLPILVVDDNATNRRILEEVLTSWHARPTAVDGGSAALIALREAHDRGSPFPLVLLDGEMPGMDGFTLAETIGEDRDLAGTIIMMLSSTDRSGDLDRCQALGIAARLTKPIRQSELLRVLTTVLNREMEDSAALEAPPAEEHGDWRPEDRSSRRLKVLLAEDQVINQKVATCILEKMGHTVAVADDGKMALAALRREAFDLVLMDVQMPEMDGLEAIAAIREAERATGLHLPTIALTAHAMKGDRERCLDAGFDSYVAKPIRSRDLYEAIEALLSTGGETRRPETKSEREAPPVLAFDRSEALACVGGDEALLREVLELFLAEAPRWLAAVRDAAHRGDPVALRRAAHTIKGTASHLAAPEVIESARKLELAGVSGDLSGIVALLSDLEGSLGRLQADVAGLVSHPAS